MSLEEQASDRKSRLAALRNKRKVDLSNSEENEPVKKIAMEKTTIKSRNFDPETRSDIKGSNLPPSIVDENLETVEAVSQRIQNEVLSKFKDRSDITNINGNSNESNKPKSISWDLKRDIQENLDSLQEKTDDAIKKIVKERIRKLRENNKEIEDEVEERSKGSDKTVVV